MRRSLALPRIVAPMLATPLVLAFAAVAATASDPGEADERLASAGFPNARTLPGIEVARITGDDGSTFHVVSGLDRMSGFDDLMDRGEVAPPATMRPAAADTSADVGTVEALDEAAEIGLSLDELLPEAGFDDYVLLEQAHVAEMVVGGTPLQILFGLEAEGND